MSAQPSKSQRVIELGETLLSNLREMEGVGLAAPLSSSQIQNMQRMIQERVDSITRAQLPPRNMRFNYLTRETIDSWPLGIPLATLVCEFEERYNNL